MAVTLARSWSCSNGAEFHRYRYICKIHGKKSIDGGRKMYTGEMWRRRLLFDLIGAPGAANAAIDMFERDPSVGMIGPKVFRLPKAGYPEDLSLVGQSGHDVEDCPTHGICPPPSFSSISLAVRRTLPGFARRR